MEEPRLEVEGTWEAILGVGHVVSSFDSLVSSKDHPSTSIGAFPHTQLIYLRIGRIRPTKVRPVQCAYGHLKQRI